MQSSRILGVYQSAGKANWAAWNYKLELLYKDGRFNHYWKPERDDSADKSEDLDSEGLVKMTLHHGSAEEDTTFVRVEERDLD